MVRFLVTNVLIVPPLIYFRSAFMDARRRSDLDPIHVGCPQFAFYSIRSIPHEWKSPLSNDHGDVLSTGSFGRQNAL